jgi:O-antigen ligase
VLLFFVVVRLFPDRRALDRLMVFAAVLGALTGVVSVLLATTHHLPALFQTVGQGFAQEQQGITGDLNRVRLPGAALAYGLLWFAALRMLRGRGAARAGWALVVAGMIVNLALSFNRNMWVGALAGLAALLVLGGVRVRRSFALGGSIAAVTVAICLLAGVGVSKKSPVEPIIQRGTTLLNPRAVTQENSLEDRAHETQKALVAIEAHPLQGVGPGAEFGVSYSERQADGSYRPAPQLFLHDQYLYLVLAAGIPALLAFLCFLVAVLRRGWRLLGDPDVMVWTVGVGMIMLSAFVMITYAAADMLTILMLLAGAIVASSEPRLTRLDRG